MTIGSKHASSPYEISGFEAGLQQTGAETIDCALGSVYVDHENKITRNFTFLLGKLLRFICC